MTSTYLLKKDYEKEFLTLLKDMLKQIINTSMIMILKNINDYNPKIFGEDYAAIHEIKPVLILNKPTYVEFTFLDLSKWEM